MYRFLIVLAIVTALYLVYGVHAAAHHDTLLASYTAGYSHSTPPTLHEQIKEVAHCFFEWSHASFPSCDSRCWT